MKAFLFLCAFHIIGDFYLQPKCMAENKDTKPLVFALHIIIYGIIMFIPFHYFVSGKMLLFCELIIILSHTIADLLKGKLNNPDDAKTDFLWFCGDQVFHLVIIIICYFLFVHSDQQRIAKFFFTYQSLQKYMALGIIALCIIKPSELLVTKALKIFTNNTSKAPSDMSSYEVKVSKHPSSSNSFICEVKTQSKCEEKTNDNKAGTYIGYLERIIVVALILINAPTAIGFVLTAKSIARYKQFEEQSFTERYLVGTLLSVSIALLAVLLVPKIYPF